MFDRIHCSFHKFGNVRCQPQICQQKDATAENKFCVVFTQLVISKRQKSQYEEYANERLYKYVQVFNVGGRYPR